MADDRVRAELEAIKERADNDLRRLPNITARRLVTALEATLDHHQPRQLYQMITGLPNGGLNCGHSNDYDGDAHFEADDGYWYCRDKPTGKVCDSCGDEADGTLWAEWPCPTYSDIAAALLGEAPPSA